MYIPPIKISDNPCWSFDKVLARLSDKRINDVSGLVPIPELLKLSDDEGEEESEDEEEDEKEEEEEEYEEDDSENSTPSIVEDEAITPPEDQLSFSINDSDYCDDGEVSDPELRNRKAFSESRIESERKKQGIRSRREILKNKHSSLPNSPIGSTPREALSIKSPYEFLYSFDWENKEINDVNFAIIKDLSKHFKNHVEKTPDFFLYKFWKLYFYENFEPSLSSSICSKLRIEMINIDLYKPGLTIGDFYPEGFNKMFANIGFDIEKLRKIVDKFDKDDDDDDDELFICHPNVDSFFNRRMEPIKQHSTIKCKEYDVLQYDMSEVGDNIQEIWQEWCIGIYNQLPIHEIERNRYEIYLKKISSLSTSTSLDKKSIDLTNYDYKYGFEFLCIKRFKIIQFITYGIETIGYPGQIWVDLLQGYIFFNHKNLSWIIDHLDYIIEYHFGLKERSNLNISWDKIFQHYEFNDDSMTLEQYRRLPINIDIKREEETVVINYD